MLKRIAAIACGKAVLFLTKALQKGGGTAAPGLYALKLDTDLVSFFAGQLLGGSVVISGTNGKTTTSRLISHYFSQQAIPYIHNRAGSNLERGIVSACITACSLSGRLNQQYGVWELDEAAFAKIVNKIKPKYIVLLNLFRDQLDRYGEVDATKNKWITALQKADYPTTVLYNGDDPQLIHLAQQVTKQNAKVQFQAFSIAPKISEKEYEKNLLSPMELTLCPQCRNTLQLQQTIVGLGRFHCTMCNLTNPDNSTHITSWTLTPQGSRGEITTNGQQNSFEINFPGVFNLYNFAAACAYIKAAELDYATFISQAKQYQPAFARMEHISYQGNSYILTLIKNPTGFTESLRTIFDSGTNYQKAAFILNDNFADGLDVSWIWDVNLSKYIPVNLNKVSVSGSRAYDMALRLNYAGVPKDKLQIRENIREIFEEQPEQGIVIPVFATYTASLEIQKVLEKIGVKSKYWKE